jgi:hypothetical protein
VVCGLHCVRVRACVCACLWGRWVGWCKGSNQSEQKSKTQAKKQSYVTTTLQHYNTTRSVAYHEYLNSDTYVITTILLYLSWRLHLPRQVRSATHTHKAHANSSFYVGVSPAQAVVQLAEQASDKLVTLERAVALLGGTGPDVGD